MNILNPNNTTHTLKIIPRFYPLSDVVLELVSEEREPGSTITILPTISNGYMFLQFDKAFKNATNWQVKVTGGNEIVYRGKLLVTSQASDTQNYKTTKDIFLL
ncbi:hypothetical protein HYN59_07245 [Flavobacterium album]|uniref:Uncharacterized protein n=1 Tax=Flavobacterium album TaxID=2175091 RepID=A0A2S1QX25_9FLAO|nr:hypothetical protein [Flavobacterium album]AWH84934.1 hypothetical protein HYN59_07245 [Flavobacterium album]